MNPNEKFFSENTKGQIIFEGDLLEVYIPEIYNKHNCLVVGDEIETLAIFDMKINSKIDSGYLAPCKMKMLPDHFDWVNVEDQKMLKVVFKKGNVFFKSLEYLQEDTLAYTVFLEMINNGRIPNFLSYEDQAELLDIITEVTGMRFPSSHTVHEIIPAFLNRHPEDISIQHRLTDLKLKPITVPMKNVVELTQSFTASSIGGYAEDSLTKSLITSYDSPSLIEEILRS